MTSASAHAKVNLALVVGSRRPDGKHEVATVLQRLELADRVSVERGPAIEVTGFTDDTLVRTALERLAAVAPEGGGWAAHIEKEIPVAAGLGGGSSDAATALRLANATLVQPLSHDELSGLAATLGADVPFFLLEGPQLGTGDGSQLSPVVLPHGYHVVLVWQRGAVKASTGAVYRMFDERRGDVGFAGRKAALGDALAAVTSAPDLAALPANDLASSPLSARLRDLGAFRADVSGAGPVVYGLFLDRGDAEAAAAALVDVGRAWITRPA